MIFVIPIILGAVALGSAALGVKAGAEGVSNIKEAQKIGERAQERYERAISNFRADFEATNRFAETYGQLQLQAKVHTIGRFVAFIEKIGQRGSLTDLRFLDGLDISSGQIEEYKAAVIEAEEWLTGGVSAAVTAAAAASVTANLARSVGTTMVTTTVTRFFGLWTTEVVAEVGISQLTGAAARSATLAWLGGGSMAVGGFVLGGITLGPALMVGGFQLASKSEKALTKAREYEATVNTEIKKIEAAQEFLKQVEQRISELSGLVHKLESRAMRALDEMESQPFDRKRDASKFQQVALLIKALAEIMKTPVLNEEGNLNPALLTITAKYQLLGDN